MEYSDMEGNPISLRRLVISEPDWACSRIKVAQEVETERDTLAQRVEGLELSNKLLAASAESDRKQNRQFVQDRDLLRQRVKELEADKRELMEALEPFANFACDDWHVCECHNCRGKRVIAKAKHKGEG
jgi:hypothetical protein